MLLKKNPIQVLLNKRPHIVDFYENNGWKLPSSIDRVYVSNKASSILGYVLKYTFDFLIKKLKVDDQKIIPKVKNILKKVFHNKLSMQSICVKTLHISL